MPFRFFVPLPGPFFWTPRSRAEKHYDRELKAARRAADTPADIRRRFLVRFTGFWAIVAWTIYFYDGGVVLAIAVAAFGLSVVMKAWTSHRDLCDEENAADDEAAAAELRRRRWAGEGD